MKKQKPLRTLFLSLLLALAFAPKHASAEETFDVERDPKLQYRIALLAQDVFKEPAELLEFFKEERKGMSEHTADAWKDLFKEIYEGPGVGDLAFGSSTAVEKMVVQYLSLITIPGEGKLASMPEELARGVKAAVAYEGRVTGAERTHPNDPKQWNVTKLGNLRMIFSKAAQSLQVAHDGTQSNAADYRRAYPNARAALAEALKVYGQGATNIEQVPNYQY